MTTKLDADRTASASEDSTLMTLVVADAASVAQGVKALVLRRADGGDLPSWAPGAHIDVVTPSGLIRQYSLSGDPADPRAWRIAVLNEPNGRGGSMSVHSQLSEGDLVQVSGPRNRFPLVPATRYSFVVGGIGITPILPMLAELSAEGHNWRLLYGGRSHSSMAFLAELAKYGDDVRVSPQDEDGLLDIQGFLGQPTDGHVVYCCGPEPLIAAVESATADWKPGSLQVERFSVRPGLLDSSRADAAFDVVLRRTGVTVRVQPDEAILDVIERAGVSVESSCREGICGTCETNVLEGVPDHRDSLLTETEQAANTCMFICVSRSLSDRLVLDL